MKEEKMIEYLQVRSSKREQLVDITNEINEVIRKNYWTNGILNLFTPHTTAGVTINEKADPCVPQDIIMKLNKLIP